MPSTQAGSSPAPVARAHPEVFKAYDIRGSVPDQLDEVLVEAVGNAFAATVARESAPAGGRPSVVVGHDMRTSSPALAAAFAAGANRAGADVTMIGLASTDQLYFASGVLGVPGAMVTASHNPAGDNGIKLCRAHAVPVGAETGLATIREAVLAGDVHAAQVAGEVREADLLEDYAAHLRRLAPVRGRRLRVVVDAGNGMAGHTAPAVLGELVDLLPLYFELDGSFPHHEANPIDPANLVDLQREVRARGADVGLAFDGDADRCFVVDERGGLVSPSALTALIADRALQREPGAAVVHNLITSRAVPEVVRARGGTPVRTRVGHSFIKDVMARTDAVFGGEHSGHFYFRDFWRADSGMLAALHLLAALAETDDPASTLLADYDRYAASGEVNSRVDDPGEAMRQVEKAFAGRPGVTVDHLDGVTVEHEDWWFNVRASNTEPLLRLNVEAADRAVMEAMREEVLALVRSL